LRYFTIYVLLTGTTAIVCELNTTVLSAKHTLEVVLWEVCVILTSELLKQH